MSLLPKSIHRCRRYPTKFNSGRDIPVIFKPLRRPRAAILRICWSVQAGLAVARVAEVGEEAGVWGMEPQIELCGGVKTNEYLAWRRSG